MKDTINIKLLDETALRIALRESMKTEEIKQNLTDMGYKILSLSRMQKIRNGTRSCILLTLAQLAKTHKQEQISSYQDRLYQN